MSYDEMLEQGTLVEDGLIEQLRWGVAAWVVFKLGDDYYLGSTIYANEGCEDSYAGVNSTPQVWGCVEKRDVVVSRWVATTELQGTNKQDT